MKTDLNQERKFTKVIKKLRSLSNTKKLRTLSLSNTKKLRILPNTKKLRSLYNTRASYIHKYRNSTHKNLLM